MLQRLNPGAFTVSLVGLQDQEEHIVGRAASAKGLLLGKPHIHVVKVPSSGSKASDGETYAAGTVLRLSYGKLRPSKHPVIADLNPELLTYGHVSLCRQYLAGEEVELVALVTFVIPCPKEELPSWQIRLSLDAPA